MIGLFLLWLIAMVLFTLFRNKTVPTFMGGSIHTYRISKKEHLQPVFKITGKREDEERFQRPSKQSALRLKYSFEDFINSTEKPPYIHILFQSPKDVIQAYYAILKEASNMTGYYGGCGTIGWATIPYPYAYELFTAAKREKVSLDQFEKSFAGIGHITLLKLLPAYSPLGTPENIKYFMVEIETITGTPYKEKNNSHAQPTYFSYYYGIITTEHSPSEGWKIKSIDYLPEDFLCAPYHHWDWDAEALVEIIYKNWYKVINKIEKMDKKDSIIRIYAKGNHTRYRFDFVRLTNGEDILLHEYVEEKGQWKETNLLQEKHQMYKLSILNPNLQ